jgi:hypothetical protein
VFSSVNRRFHALKPVIGGMLNIKHVRAHWSKILRPAPVIKQRTVTAFLKRWPRLCPSYRLTVRVRRTFSVIG